MPRFPGFPFGDDDQTEEEPRIPAAPPEYQVEHAPDPTAFLRARATPRKVVIGQAVSLKIYGYGSQGTYAEVSSNEPSREGFLAFDVDGGPNANTAVPVPIDGKVWLAHKTREMVLFPIRTGTLRIGSMRMGFQGRGYAPTPGALGLMRESPPIDITVVEPPLAGRPAGYHLGDVGQYTLTARVDPRSIKQGEAISVIARLEGTGNVPSKLQIPQQNGVDWPEPTVIDKLDADAGKVSGSRTFTFVVRLDRPGNIELGDITLPYYDADQQRYQIARAALGTIEVKPDPTAAQTASAQVSSDDRLRGLLAPRKQLGPFQTASTPLSENSGFFGLLLLGPFSVLAGTGLLRASKQLAQRLGASRATPARRAISELEAAREKARSGDLGATSAACERALHLALEGATGLKGRGVLRSELGSLLVERGLSQKNADEAVSLLEALELARFAEGQAENEAQSLFLRAEVLVSSLVRGKLG
jgi:HEPN domain-containing protein